MTTQELNAAARRLSLPNAARMSVSEAEEARTCVGCTADYRGGMRIVKAVRGCPAHSREMLTKLSGEGA